MAGSIGSACAAREPATNGCQRSCEGDQPDTHRVISEFARLLSRCDPRQASSPAALRALARVSRHTPCTSVAAFPSRITLEMARNQAPRLRSPLTLAAAPRGAGRAGDPQHRQRRSAAAPRPASVLHLVVPWGFASTRSRCGGRSIDYWHLVEVRRHSISPISAMPCPPRVGCSSALPPSGSYLDADFRAGDALLFGRESVGLADDLLGPSTVPRSTASHPRPGAIAATSPTPFRSPFTRRSRQMGSLDNDVHGLGVRHLGLACWRGARKDAPVRAGGNTREMVAFSPAATGTFCATASPSAEHPVSEVRARRERDVGRGAAPRTLPSFPVGHGDWPGWDPTAFVDRPVPRPTPASRLSIRLACLRSLPSPGGYSRSSSMPGSAGALDPAGPCFGPRGPGALRR